MRAISAVPALVTLTHLLRLATASCECGYKTNTNETWQYAVVTNFGTLDSSQWSTMGDDDWVVSDLTREATINLAYTPSNVVLSNSTGTLDLTCSAYNASNPAQGIRSGQIRTTRADIKYGSFRARFSVHAASEGSVAGFFFYANDTQEIDVEIPSRFPEAAVHLANQPSTSLDVYSPNNATRDMVQEYRFDWSEGATSWYIENVPAWSVEGGDKDVPVVDGTISLNMWGNGGPFSGKTPPSTDNVMRIESITMYFNTSSKAEAKEWEKSCKAGRKAARKAARKDGGEDGGEELVCVVDSQGLQVNRTAQALESHTKTSTGGGSRTAAVGVGAIAGIGAALFL
jgi:hypothetical protein